MRVFISRALQPDAEFSRLLPPPRWAVRGFSLLCLTPLPFHSVPASDWIFFYSQHAVHFFFQNPIIASFPKDKVKWGAIGPATARELECFTQKVDCCGNGNPADTALVFSKMAEGQSVLFPCARHSRHSIQQLLGGAIKGTNLEIYDNVPLETPPMLPDDVLVFTSPLNARAYFAKYGLAEGQRVVSIGLSTAEALRALGVLEFVVSDDTTEAGLARAVESLF